MVTKRHCNAFSGTDLEDRLKRAGVKTIVIGGITTNYGVESTGRAAAGLGLGVVFIEDATTSIGAEAHQSVRVRNDISHAGACSKDLRGHRSPCLDYSRERLDQRRRLKKLKVCIAETAVKLVSEAASLLSVCPPLGSD